MFFLDFFLKNLKDILVPTFLGCSTGYTLTIPGEAFLAGS